MGTISEDKIKVVIFCGGRGTRMWPVSSVGHPKQFSPLVGTKSFFRQTIERVLSGFSPENIYISTGKSFAGILREQAPEIPQKNIIFEPEMRDNTGSVALSCVKLNYLFPDSVMLLLWGADHIVKKKDEFIHVLKKAAAEAYNNDKIVHVDMKPSFPSVHNGWVKIGKTVKKLNSYKIVEFLKQIEKPDLLKAQKFFNSGKYLIHSGYMATKPSFLLSLMKKYDPPTYNNAVNIASAFGTPNEKSSIKRLYSRFERNSIDYTLFEKLPPGVQWDVPVDIGWVDVGSWELLYHGLPKDKNGNLLIGKAELLDVKNCLIIARREKTMGLIGLSDMIVVDTDDGILVCPLARSKSVKPLYKKIFKQK